MGNRRGPSTPEAIAARRAAQRQAEREREAEERAQARASARDPASWGVAPPPRGTAGAQDLDLRRGHRAAIVQAKRLDAFTAMFERGGLSGGQHAAAMKLMDDMAIRMGVRAAPPELGTRVDGGDSAGISDTMLAAGDRIEDVLSRVGRADRQLLEGLAEEQMQAREGVTTWWRGRVQTVTAETDKTAQGARVRGACENLRLAYAEIERFGPGRARRAGDKVYLCDGCPDGPAERAA